MTGNSPLVSVIIATYNMGQYLSFAIESVLRQTWEDLELIIIDDGSTDDTSQLVREFSDARLRYIATENQGQPKAKNRGLQEAKGEFIAFCDGDDLWNPYKLAIQLPYFKEAEVGVVYSEVTYIDEHGESVSKTIPYGRYSGKVTEYLIIKNFVPFGTAMFRRRCFDEFGGFDEDIPMGIDWDLWLRYSVRWEFRYVPRATYIYRIWSGQMSKDYRGRYDNAFLILKKFIDLHPESVPSSLKARAWSDMYATRAISLAITEDLFIEPLFDAVKGVGHDFTYWVAWKTLLKLILWKLKVRKIGD